MSDPSLAHPLHPRRSSGILRGIDFCTHSAAFGGSLLLIALLVILLVVVFQGAYPTLSQFGLSFLYTSRWNPVTGVFGAWPFIYSTLITSAVALVIAFPVSLGSAIFLTKLAPKLRIPVPAFFIGRQTPTGWTYITPRYIVAVASFLIELLAAIPSIAYGLWGIAVLIPIMQSYFQPFLGHTLGKLPLVGFLFASPSSGFNIFSASVVLAIMITPIITAIIRDVLAVAPPELEQGALGLGATWWQAMKLVIGYSKMGIFGAVILGFARAMGETMAVTMIIGNSKPNSYSLFEPGQTIASQLANQFNNADTDAEVSALVCTALVLLVITTLINGVARVILMRVATGKKKP